MGKNLDDFRNSIEPYLDGFDCALIFEHGNRHPDEIAKDIINLAREYGFYAFDEKTFQGRIPDATDEYYSDALTDTMEEAIEYLAFVIPEGYWIGNDGYAGAFGVWRCEDRRHEILDQLNALYD